MLQGYSAYKQSFERPDGTWGDAGFYTNLQNMLVQLVGLYTTFITAIESDHLTVHLGWSAYLSIMLGLGGPIAALPVFQFRPWLTPLVLFGGSVGNAFLGVNLLVKITERRQVLNRKHEIELEARLSGNVL
jgi:hypothetical protein